MITIPEVVEELVRSSPNLMESLSMGLINISALARRLKPSVEEKVMKDIQEGAVIMALNRLSRQIMGRYERQRNIFSSPPDLMVRSNLFEMTFANSDTLLEKQKRLLAKLTDQRNYFLTFTQGIFETTLIAGRDLYVPINAIFQKEKIISQILDLSSITVQLPSGTAQIPGAYAFLLKAIAWEDINLVEVVSTLNELTMILYQKDIDRAFTVIKQLF